jgi:hypothetical protein
VGLIYVICGPVNGNVSVTWLTQVFGSNCQILQFPPTHSHWYKAVTVCFGYLSLMRDPILVYSLLCVSETRI